MTYVSIGEGSTSQGEFWESLNTASNSRLPVLYVIEDNGYAISTPVEANTPGGNISKLIANFPNFRFWEVDGTDAIASYKAMVEAVAYCRSGQGPAVVHGHVTRPYSHSLSDDERLYRSKEEIDADALRDPIRGCRCGCCARAFSMSRASMSSSGRLTKRCRVRRSVRWRRCCRRRSRS